MVSFSDLISVSFFGAMTLKSLTSAAIAELLMTSIIQRLLALGDSNEGIKRIFDQGLNAAISGGINIKAYELLVKKSPNIEGKLWYNYEEFFAQMLSDAVGEVLSCYYLVPLFGSNTSNVTTIYG